MFKKILIANRGEIACRIARSCRRLGVAAAGVHSAADRDALHVREIGESVEIGGAAASESYLRIDAVIAAAKAVGAEAIHPGFGFLAENAAFARAVEAAGLVFIGPTPEVIERLGDKAAAKRAADAAGVPIVPGSQTPSTDPAEIAATVRRFASQYTHVFTSGGVGPTHDDLTIAGVAQAFDVDVERNAELEQMLRNYYSERGIAVVERNLRMADAPRGVTLVLRTELPWPILLMRNVYILPGIPEVFRRKFIAIRESFRDAPFHLRQIFVRSEEGEIARHLDEIAARYVEVALGSYPLMKPAEDGHRVKLTLESKDLAAVDRATEELANLLGTATIVRRA